MKYNYTHAVALVLGLIIGALGIFWLSSLSPAVTDAQRIAEFYETENAVAVSPHTLRTLMSEGRSDEFVLVDLRTQAEYEKEHIISAINIPGFADPTTDEERIVAAFSKIRDQNPNKDIIVHCYSQACMLGRKVGKLLAEHDIYVKHLNIGWNEWRYGWEMWNSDSEEPTRVEDYIYSGKEPGVPKVDSVIAPCSQGELGC